ncbi:MAG: hypothetical protein WEA56_13690 [Balneolaceae bacterium]
MQHKLFHLILFILIVLTFQGCEIIADIFRAGVWVGVIAIILVIALVIYLIRKMNQP